MLRAPVGHDFESTNVQSQWSNPLVYTVAHETVDLQTSRLNQKRVDVAIIACNFFAISLPCAGCNAWNGPVS